MVSYLYQGFTVNAYPPIHASSIVVTVDGKSVVPIEFPENITKGYWKYIDGSNPISMGSGPSTRDIIVSYKYGNNVCQCTVGAPPGEKDYKITLNVFAVVPVTAPGSNDLVRDHTNLVRAGVSGEILTANMPSSGTLLPAREIHNSFSATGPQECGGSFGGITVGIIQTVQDSSNLGAIGMTSQSNSASHGLLTMRPNDSTNSLP